MDLSVVTQAKTMVDRGDDVAGNEWIRCGEGTDLIAAAIDLSLRETATEQHQTVAVIPVISTCISRVDFGCSSEVTEDGDDRAFE